MRCLLAGGMLILALTAGCAAPYGVRHASPEEVHRALTGSVLSTGVPSGFSEITLRRHNLAEYFEQHPEEALAALRERVLAEADPTQGLFSLAELSFFYAGQSKQKPYFLAAAVYAYAYLFPWDQTKAPDPFDSRIRLACDLYNRALTEAFKAPDGTRVQLAAGVYPLPFGTLTVEFDEADLLWGNRRLIDFVPAGELEVTGFRNRYRQPGLGAPLAAKTERVDPNDPADSLFGPRVRVSATALLRLEKPRVQLLTGSQLHARLELHESTNEEHVTINDRSVPLELEPTATLAQTLAEGRPWEAELSAFLGSLVNARRPLQLAAREPYRRGRIPVVFVHGTNSSVTRWADMVNDLDADPVLRQHFQFWFFSYDSGNPIGYSGMILRRALVKAIHDLDPDGHDECLQRMVVIGHSQGGLLTKLTAIDSGDRFWQNISDVPLDELHISDETRALLREAVFIKPLPFVRRLVFVATPHRGSYLAGPQFVRRLARQLISMPASLVQASADLLSRDDLKPYLKMQRLPTAIDNMSPGHPFIRTIAELSVAPGIAAHSIIGVIGHGPKEDGADGVVKYKSAHIEPVESELVVDSPHSMQSHPQVVGEVQRILHLHAEQNVCAP